MTITLRDDQQTAIEKLRESYAAGRRRIVMQAPTGFGKTVLAGALLKRARELGNRVIFTAPALSLIDQTVDSLRSQGIAAADIGVLQANHRLTDPSRPVQVASVSTLARRKIPPADVVIIDECFAGGTLVSTPAGERRIDNLKIGDAVNNALGVGFVAHVFRQQKPTIQLRLSNGRTILVTDNHPFLVEDGWRRARDLAVGSRLFSKEAVLALRNYDDSANQERRHGCARRAQLEKTAFLLRLLCEEAREPHAGSCNLPKGFPILESGRASPDDTRREWAIDTVAAATLVDSAWSGLATGIGSTDKNAERRRLPDLLQNRSGKSLADDRNRSQRQQSLFAARKAQGSEEGGFLGDVRVENISSDERTSNNFVYNLHITGHPSYFAGGVLAHNCHRWYKFYEQWLTEPDWTDVPFIGLSATPWTKGLGKWFEELIVAGTTAQCIEAGTLSPFKVYAPSHPDLTGVKIVAGDYHEGQLSRAMSGPSLVADIVTTWLARGESRPTLCFCVNCKHAELIQAQFAEAGVPCGYQDAGTPMAERTEIKRKFHNGEYSVVCNVGTLTTGIDWDVRCLILARPTKSEILFVQIVGRGLRTAPGKDHCLILDHSDNHTRLGFVTDIHHEVLDDGKPKPTGIAPPRPEPVECPSCGHLNNPGALICSECGYQIKLPVTQEDGELEELKAPPPRVPLKDQKITEVYGGLLWIANERGFKPGWVAYKFKEIYGYFPQRGWNVESQPPSKELLAFVRQQYKAWARTQRAAARIEEPDDLYVDDDDPFAKYSGGRYRSW